MTISEIQLARLEHRIGRLLAVGVTTSSAALALGLACWLLGTPRGLVELLLQSGLMFLMATPVVRVVLSFAAYVRERDWFFALTTLAVLAVLATTVLVAWRAAG